MKSPRFFTLVGIIAIAALSRLLPHAWNFTPIAAIALFGGAEFSNWKRAYFVPLITLFVSDLFLGFYGLMPVVYACFIATVVIGRKMHDKISIGRVIGSSLVASILFFVVTNFACWLTMPEYTKDASGFVACYTLALPFFRNTLVGDLLFSGLLFGSFALSEKTFPVLRETTA